MKKSYFWLITALFIAGNVSAQMDLTDGIKFIENENFGEAITFFESVKLQEPKKGLPIYYLGKIQYDLEEYDMAKQLFDESMTVDKKCILCSIGQAMMMREIGEVEQGDKILATVAKRNKKSAEILASVGDAYLFTRTPDYKQAIEYLTLSRDLDPSVGSTWAHLGDAYTKENLAGEAMTAYETAVKKDQTNVEAYLSMSKIWSATNNKDLAIQQLEHAVELASDYAPAYKALYEAYLRYDVKDKVLPALEKYISLAGDDELAKMRLIRFMLFDARDYDRVIENGLELQKTSKDHTLDRWLAYAYAEKGDFVNADQHMKILDNNLKSIKEDSYDADTYYKGKIAMGLEDYETGLAYYHKLWEKDPTGREDVLGNLAKRFYDAKDYDNAIKFYKEKAEFTDLGVSEQYLLAGSYYAKKDWDNSLIEFKKLVETNPNYAMGWYNIAKCIEKSDPDYETYPAMDDFEKFLEVANELSPEDRAHYTVYMIDAYMYLGYGHIVDENSVAAKEAFESVLALNPDHERAKEYVEILSGH